jgi:hypothetical protein
MKRPQTKISCLGLIPILALGSLLSQPAARGEDALALGNAAFKEGKFDEAAKLYESEDDTSNLLTRRFNSGVSHARAGAIDKAIERFEEVSARAEGELRASAFHNAGGTNFEKGKALAQKALEIQEPAEKVKMLTEAAKAYRSASEFFRQVRPSDEQTSRDIAVVKTALRGVLDQIARIEEEEKKKAEEEALKSPPELVRAIAKKERLHRAMSRTLSGEAGGKLRLASRQLRKSTMENRGLAEKLAHHLENPPAPAAPPAGAPPGAQAPQGPSEEEKARNARAAEALERAIAAMKDAELAYGKLAAADATQAHSKAIVELRSAMEALPLDIATLIQEALSTQEAVGGALESLVKTEKAGLPDEIKGSGLGKTIVEALSDKVLKPLAKLVTPKTSEDAKVLADEEDDVVWGSGILSQAEIQAPQGPAAPQGQPSQGPAPGQELTPEKAKELSEALRKEGAAAREASSKAREELAAGRASPALPEATKALEALRRAADLLPKPPEPPEERLKKLIERQKGAARAAEGLAALQGEARNAPRAELSKAQRGDGKEAGSIGEELEKRPDEPGKKAAGKVREGEAQVYSSAEALDRDRLQDGKLAIERDIKCFEEALALLGGKDQNQEQEKQERQEQDQGQDQQKKDAENKRKEDNQYALTPREARLRQEEMDRERREEEEKLFVGPSGETVEKDW